MNRAGGRSTALPMTAWRIALRRVAVRGRAAAGTRRMNRQAHRDGRVFAGTDTTIRSDQNNFLIFCSSLTPGTGILSMTRRRARERLCVGEG
jgi:hypothetical protein